VSLVAIPRRSIWPTPESRSIWPGVANAAQRAVAAIAAKYSAPYWLPSPSSCWQDVAGTPAVEGSLVKVLLDERYKGQLGPEIAPAFVNYNSTGSPVLPATLTSTVNGSFGLQKTGVFTIGKLYRVELSWSGNTNSRTVTANFGNAVSDSVVRYIPAVATNVVFYLAAALIGETVTFNSISIKEVLGHNAVAGTSAASMILRRNLNRAPMVSPTTGETWSFLGTHIAARSGIAWDTDGVPYLNCSGVASNYASTPDSAALSIVGDYTIEAKVNAVDWTPATKQGLGSKLASDSGELSLSLNTNGTLNIQWYSATVLQSSDSTVAVPFADGATGWVRVKVVRGVTAIFETSVDGLSWTQLGTTKDISLLLAPTDSANPLLSGALVTGANTFNGKIYYVKIWNNATGAGTPVAEFNPAAANVYRPTSHYLDGDGAATFYDLSSALGILRNVAGATMVVAQQELATSERYRLSVGTAIYTIDRVGLRQDSSQIYTAAVRRLDSDGVTLRATVSSNNLRLVASSRVNYAAGVFNARTNGVNYAQATLPSSGNTSDTASAGVAIGGMKSSAIVAFGWSSGPFSAGMICPALMTEAEAIVVERYFGSKNGVTI